MAKGGFRGGMPGGMNQAAMMKQAQKLQQEMIRMQQEQEAKTFTAKAGGGMVSATVNGKHELVGLRSILKQWIPMMWRCCRIWFWLQSTRQCVLLMLKLPTTCPV